jgi:hypothetical protein
MPWKGCVLEYLNGHLFPEILENFCYAFVEYITYIFGLHLFSFFNVYDLQAEILHILFATLESFVQEFFCLSFNI